MEKQHKPGSLDLNPVLQPAFSDRSLLFALIHIFSTQRFLPRSRTSTSVPMVPYMDEQTSNQYQKSQLTSNRSPKNKKEHSHTKNEIISCDLILLVSIATIFLIYVLFLWRYTWLIMHHLANWLLIYFLLTSYVHFLRLFRENTFATNIIIISEHNQSKRFL